MSNHQPQPPFGPFYNPHFPGSSPSAVNYGVQRYASQTPAYNGYWQGQAQGSTNSVPFPPNSNGFARPANAQSSVPPAFSGVQTTAYGGYPGMSQYNSTPPQFFSAPHNPAYPLNPHAPQPQVISENVSREPLATHTSIYHPLPDIPSVGLSKPEATKEPSVDLEDGELSSGEPGKSAGAHHGNVWELHEDPPPKVYKAQAVKSSDDASRDSFYSSINTANQIPASSFGSTEGQNKLLNQSTAPSSTRERALLILKELHSYDIGFGDIVREGFDAELLKELFDEAKLPIPGLEQQKQQRSIEVVNQQPSTATTAQIANHDDLHISHGGNAPLSSELQTTEIRGNDALDTAPALKPSDDGKVVMSQPDTHIVNPPVPTSVKGSAKTRPDRKEYIARLMAAKIGKPLQNPESASEKLQMAAEVTVSASKAENQLPVNAEANSATDDKAGPSTISSGIQKEAIDLETKRRAQTDLARQKMEALRAQKQLQVQVQPLIPEKQNPRSQPLPLHVSDSASHNSIENPSQAEGLTPSDARQTSYFSPVSLKPAFSIPGLFTVAPEASTVSPVKVSEPPKPSTSTSTIGNAHAVETGLGPRKRLKAADFMESTSTKFYKTFSPSEDPGVVIDISDDESIAEHDVGHLSVTKTALSSGSTTTGGEPQDSVLATPIDGKPSAKNQEPQELKMKESAIQSMNRKILELEQRIKAKQAASRAQSPQPSKISTSNGTTLQEPELPSMIPQDVETATEEQLVKEKEKQQDELASAEAEQYQIANHELWDGIKDLPTSRDAELPRSTSKSTSDQDGVEAELDRERLSGSNEQHKTKLLNELSMLDPDIETAEKIFQKAKIEMDRLNESLELARLDLEHRQSELRRKADRKNVLLGQLAALPKSELASLEIQGTSGEAVDANTVRRETGELSDLNPDGESTGSILPQPDVIRVDSASTNQSDSLGLVMSDSNSMAAVSSEARKDVGELQDISSGDVETVEHLDVDQRFDGELEEGNMDISGSDRDEEEALQELGDQKSEKGDIMDTSEDEDFYEPPSISNVAESKHQDMDVRLESPPHNPVPAFSEDQVDEIIAEESIASPAKQTSSAEQIFNQRPVQAEEKDDEDYEPPEPEASGNKDTDSVAHSSLSHDQSSQEFPNVAANDEQLTVGSASESGHFIPYESLLKQFPSYRYHPDFINEVSGGYRSLTYNNGIKADVELCQYELGGGTCNDKSCMSQHFEVLPDHAILSTMGKAEGSTPEEKDAYFEGLKSLVTELRERNIKDLDAVAAAMARYRRDFLHDTSRVLALYSAHS